MSTETAEPQVETTEHSAVGRFHTHRATLPAAWATSAVLVLPFLVTLVTGTRGFISVVLLVLAVAGAWLALHVRTRAATRAQSVTVDADALLVEGAGGRRRVAWADITSLHYSYARLAILIERRGAAGALVVDGDLNDIPAFLAAAARRIDATRRTEDGGAVRPPPAALLRRPARLDAALVAVTGGGILLGLLAGPAWLTPAAIALPLLVLHWTRAPFGVSVDDTAVWIVRPLARDVLPLRALRDAKLGVAGRPANVALLLEHRDRGTIALTGMGARTLPLLDGILAALRRDREAQRGGPAARRAGTATLRSGSRHSALITAAITLLALIGLAWTAVLTGIPLRTAARHGGEVTTRAALLLGGPRSAPGGDGLTALHIAAAGNEVAIARMLIAKGANIDAHATGSAATPLHEAAERGHRDVVGALIEARADVNARGTQGRPPLAQAALADAPGDTAIVRMLLDAGADIDGVDDRGRSALHYAALNGHSDLVRLLSRRGAALERADSLGHRALHAAVSMRQQGTAEALLRAGADPDAPGRAGRTAIAAAAADGAPLALVGALLDGGARADVADDEGWNAVQLAASTGSVELLELFARRRARLDATDGRVAPALWIAAEAGNIEAARALLRGGANPRLRWDNRSPLDIAQAKRSGRMLALMQMR